MIGGPWLMDIALSILTSIDINHEKTFRDLGSGFVYYIVTGTSVYKKRSRTTKMKKLSSKEKILQVRMLKENLKKMKKRKDRKEKNEKEKNEKN